MRAPILRSKGRKSWSQGEGHIVVATRQQVALGQIYAIANLIMSSP